LVRDHVCCFEKEMAPSGLVLLHNPVTLWRGEDLSIAVNTFSRCVLCGCPSQESEDITKLTFRRRRLLASPPGASPNQLSPGFLFFIPTGIFLPLPSGKGIPARYKWYTASYRSNFQTKIVYTNGKQRYTAVQIIYTAAVRVYTAR
jgi:hypothetical protein